MDRGAPMSTGWFCLPFAAPEPGSRPDRVRGRPLRCGRGSGFGPGLKSGAIRKGSGKVPEPCRLPVRPAPGPAGRDIA